MLRMPLIRARSAGKNNANRINAAGVNQLR